MFERRLKTVLIILLVMIGLLGLRAFHLQVVTRANWVKEAEDFAKRPILTETTRGRILDRNGQEIAVDQACMDACVDYRAISRDPKWINQIAAQRLRDRLGDAYSKAPKKQREEMVEQESKSVNDDISNMWLLLAKESGQTPEQIADIRHAIDLKVAMRSRWIQYKRFQQADKAHDAKGAAPWYKRWLIEGGDDGPKIDDFEQVSGEEVDVHPILKNITPEMYVHLGKQAAHCPGLVLKAGTHRVYPFGRAGAQLLGHLSPVTEEDLKNDPNQDPDNPAGELRAYEFTDLIGRGGLESLCEPALRGARGKILRQVGKENDEVIAKPLPGSDVRTTIDISLQRQIQEMFAHCEVPNNIKPGELPDIVVPMHGAAVVIDVKTGQVLALASYPDYDPNTLSEDYESLVTDNEDAPLMNRATQSILEPGSTIKPVVGIGAITQGVIGVHEGIECTGFLVLNGHKYPNGRCWVATKYIKMLGVEGVKHHPVPIPHHGRFGNPDGFLIFSDALERSCNVYFENLADRLGIDKLSFWMDRMGLGHETGLGISEACGRLPRDLASHGHFERSSLWFSGIGQVGVRVTPIQMANVAATIARDGTWMRPRLIETSGIPLNPVKPRDGKPVPDEVDLHLNKDALAAAREGMIRVVNAAAGTGTLVHMDNLLVAGKTGTAEAARILDPVKGPNGELMHDEKGKVMYQPRVPATADHPTDTPWYRGWNADGSQLNHAWFIGFAPANPGVTDQIAVSVMVQYGGSGGLTAGNIAKKIFQSCIQRGYIKPGTGSPSTVDLSN
jgi:penicillin-binding protein 2